MLQKANRRAAAEKTVRKIEAGAIAFVTAQTISLSTGRAGQAILRNSQVSKSSNPAWCGWSVTR
jgi:hypothetical protein